MKTFGVLFDVSGSMKKKFENIKNSDKVNKKSDELINILKKLGANMNSNIFAILFGLKNSPYIIDFIKLLQMFNEKFKNITSTEKTEENRYITIYRDKLIDLLSKDRNGNWRYCNIREYVMSENGPKERLSEFLCNLMEDDREIIDKIYNKLPIEVINENANRNLNRRINSGMTTAMVITGILFFGVGCLIGYGAVNYKINNSKKEETINAIKNSFKLSIELKTKKIINEYNSMNNQHYQIIKGENILQLIEDMEKKIVQPEKDENISIVDLFENIIYGETPLYSSWKKACEIFENNESKTKVLFIISDGLLNDINDIISVQNEIKQKMNNLDIITICIYLNRSKKLNNKVFYNEVQNHFDDGAKFLFNISSELNYHNGLIKFFIKKDWIIPLNGVCKLFVEINNSEDLNQFIQLINEALDYNEPIDYINKTIGDILLDKIIDENYIGQFNSENQKGGRCWAWALSAIIYLASSRIFGRKIKKFENIVKEILTNENAYSDDENNQGRPLFNIARNYLAKYGLRGRIISSYEARKALIKGRPCLCRFYLDGYGWHNFSEFFRNNPKGVLTKNYIDKRNFELTEDDEEGGHAVVLTSIEKNGLKFLNSWGKSFGDKGYFRIENEDVLSNLEFMDVFWYESDLTQNEISLYYNNYLAFIKQASNYLSDPNINIKEELKKEVQCPKCDKNLHLESFELNLHQNHGNNIGEELRKLKVKCLECQQEFESDSITTLLYISTILN